MNAPICSSVTVRNRRFYDTNADAYCRATEDADMATLQKVFVGYLPKYGSLLDAGCGSGRDSLAFSNLGLDVTAIDASREMVAAAKKRGVRAGVLLFQEMNFDLEFDGIWASGSLLHVPRRELHDVLRRFRRALKPNGILFASMKSGSGEKIEGDGRFFSYYTAAEFQQYLRLAGFRALAQPQLSGPVNKGSHWMQFISRPVVQNVSHPHPTETRLSLA